MDEPFVDREGRLLLSVDKKVPTKEEVQAAGYQIVEYYTAADKRRFYILLPLKTSAQRLETLKAEFALAASDKERIAVLAKALGLV